MTATSNRAALRKLLVKLFNESQLKSFMQDFFEAHASGSIHVLNSVPEEADIERLAREYIAQLERAGAPQEKLREALVRSRPAQRARIEAVWGERNSDATVSSPSSRSELGPRSLAVVVITSLAVGASAGWFAAREWPRQEPTRNTAVVDSRARTDIEDRIVEYETCMLHEGTLDACASEVEEMRALLSSLAASRSGGPSSPSSP